jgi:hypothetical protein
VASGYSKHFDNRNNWITTLIRYIFIMEVNLGVSYYVKNVGWCFFNFFYYQLATQISCSFTQITLIKILYMFRTHSAHHQELHDANCTYAASGIVTLCKWLSCVTAEEVLPQRLHKTVTCKEWRYQRLHMYNLRRGAPDDGRNTFETCREF